MLGEFLHSYISTSYSTLFHLVISSIYISNEPICYYQHHSAGENAPEGKDLRQQAGEIMACKFYYYLFGFNFSMIDREKRFSPLFLYVEKLLYPAYRHESKQLRSN